MRALKIALFALGGLLVAALGFLLVAGWLDQPAPPDWAALIPMKTKPVWFTQAQLNGHIEVDYRPGEREAISEAKH